MQTISEGHITVTKTARFYTLGEMNESTQQVWIVIHGFRQSAKSFLAEFEPLANGSTLLIAPEGLNRFYLDKQGTEVGATWMTREDRLNEIKDYINYLDTLYTNFDLNNFKGIITALGFSQGASTLTRWLDVTQNRIDRAIVYGGEVAPELLPLKESSGLKRTRNYFVCGTRDKFITPERLALAKPALASLNFTEIFFEGGHEINTDSIKPLINQ
jgi:predicted esterase